MASPERAGSLSEEAAEFTGAQEAHELEAGESATVTPITDAPSLRGEADTRPELTPDIIRANRKAASERWVADSTRDYGDLRFKDPKDFS